MTIIFLGLEVTYLTCKAQTAMAGNVDKRRRFVWGGTGADQEAVSYGLSAQMAIQSAVIS